MPSESIYIKANEQDTLHLKRIYENPDGEPVFLVHGSIENGKIFYTDKGKGYAHYLAAQGYDVFVADLRGRGKSTPLINGNSKFGLTEILWEDFPLYIEQIKAVKGDEPQHWAAHSWGGVLMLSYLARKPESVKVASMTFFGTKRRISIWSWKRFYMIDWGWRFIAKLAIAWKGYLPAKKLKMGADNESKGTHRETTDWVVQKPWLDWHDGFDYAAALQKMELPPALFITGANDDVLGHPTDVQLLMKETGQQNAQFQMIGKSTSFMHDYDHIDLLTHKDAREDHFPLTVDWMRKHSAVEVG